MNESLKPVLHPDFTYKAYLVGKEKTPLVVIDNFIKDAQSLIDFCTTNTRFNQADRFYPGQRMPAPENYIHVIHYYLGELIQTVFGLPKDKWANGSSLYSMIVTPPAELKAQQCIPHVDSFSRHSLACVHFLCDEKHGGTALYRHRKTEFECIYEERVDEYNRVGMEENVLGLAKKSYMNGSTEFYEQIACIDAKFNRMLIYPGAILHSGNIAPDFNFDPNPVSGRLTLNSFINGKSAH